MAIVSPGLHNPAAAVVLILLLEAEILIEGKILFKKIACVDKFNKNMFKKKSQFSTMDACACALQPTDEA